MEYKYILYQDVFSGLFHAHLCSSEFSNCDGQGNSEIEAVASLKMRVKQLESKKKAE